MPKMLPDLVEPEIWKDIPGYEGRYQVSTRGRVKTLARKVLRGGFWRNKQEKLKEGRVNDAGYVAVTLFKGDKGKTFLVHTLVLLTFIGPCPEGMECRHFPDSTRTNNNVENLSWGTRKENYADKKFHGTWQQGSRIGTSKLTEEEVAEIKMLLKERRLSQVKIAERYGVTHRVIGRILHEQSWAHVEEPN